MGEETLVAVYSVEADGVTGRRHGDGLLVGPRVVMVDAGVIGDAGQRLRVGLANAAQVEVIDVAAVHRLEGLVALELAAASNAPVAVLGSEAEGLAHQEDERDSLLAATANRLSGLGRTSPAQPSPLPDPDREDEYWGWPCRVFGIGCLAPPR